MLGRTLLPNGATGCVLGYGGNWSVAAGVAEAILPGLNSAGAHLELHVGVKAPVPATLRTAGADARLRWWQPQRRHLGSLMESLREKDSIEGALMDMSGLVLPSNAAGFLKNVSSEVLGNIFQTHGEQQDELLWSRFAEVLVAQCHRARLKNNADIPGLFAAAAKRLDDAAGPSPDAAMTALRTHLREEVETLHRCLWQIFMKLEAKCRVVLLLDRRDFAAKLRGFLRSHEEPNEALVRHWRQHKARRNTLHRFQKLRCIFRGKRSTLEVSMFMFPGRRSTLDVSCCMFFANRIVWGASSGDIVQIVWQAWISVTVSFCVAGAAFGADPSCVACHIAWQAQYLVQLQRTSVDLTLSTLYPTPSTPSTLSTLSTLYTAHCALHTPHLTLYTPHSRLYTPCSTLYTPHSTLYTPHSTLYTPLHTPHSTLYPHGRGLLVDAGQGFGEMAGNVTKVVLPQHQMKVIKHKQKMATVGQVDGYLKEAASATTWIDGVLSQACSEKLGIPVKIWWKSQHDVWTRHTCAPAFDSQRVAKIAKGEKPVVLALESKHYQWVQPPAGANVPKQLLTETVPPHYKVLAGAALRGTGASSTSSPSVHSMRSVLPLCAHDENKSPANARMSPPPGVKRSRLAAVRLLLSTTRALRTVVSARMSAHARVCPPDPEELNVIIASEGLSSLPCRQRADVILGAQKATQYGTVIVANFELLKVMPNLLSPWNTEGRPAAPYAPTGHVMPVASLMELEATPAGLRHVDTKAIPERVTMVVAAKDRPTPHNVDDAVLVKHAQVVSLCDPDHKMFVVEAICSLADMFVYNMGDGKPRFLVGTVRLAGDARIKEMPAAQHETGCRQT
eukprot:s410_g3.t2